MSFCCSHFCHHSLSNIYKLYLMCSHSPLDTVFIFVFYLLLSFPIFYLHISPFLSYFQPFLISFRVFFHFFFSTLFSHSFISSFFYFILAPFFSPASFQMLPVFKFSLYIQNNSHLMNNFKPYLVKDAKKTLQNSKRCTMSICMSI